MQICNDFPETKFFTEYLFVNYLVNDSNQTDQVDQDCRKLSDITRVYVVPSSGSLRRCTSTWVWSKCAKCSGWLRWQSYLIEFLLHQTNDMVRSDWIIALLPFFLVGRIVTKKLLIGSSWGSIKSGPLLNQL